MQWIKPVTVQLNATATAGAYQQWQGDLCRCSNCGAECVARFGQEPHWRFGNPDSDRLKPDVVVDEVPHA
jgi:hypothetical protein